MKKRKRMTKKELEFKEGKSKWDFETNRKLHNESANRKFYSNTDRISNLNNLVVDDNTNTCINNFKKLFNELEKDNGYYAILHSLVGKINSKRLNTATSLYVLINSIDPNFELINIINHSGGKKNIENHFDFYDKNFISAECKFIKSYFDFLIGNNEYSSNLNHDINKNINEIKEKIETDDKKVKYFYVMKELIKKLENNEIDSDIAIEELINIIDPDLKAIDIIRSTRNPEIVRKEIGIYNAEFIKYELMYFNKNNENSDQKKYINKI